MKFLYHTFNRHKLLIIDVALVFVALFYFAFFVNKGLVLSDEGYYVHYAERILQGEIVYRDFVLQYSPGYFYLLAFLYKIFGVQILVGRFVSLSFCIGIIFAVLLLLRLYKLKSAALHIIVAAILISLSYPLLHVPVVVWVCVFFAVLLTIFFITWRKDKKLSNLIFLGVLLAAVLLFKQNLGLIFICAINLLLFLGIKKSVIKEAVVLNSIWILILAFFLGIYYLQAHSFAGIFTMYAMSKQFIETYAFTYPSIGMLLQPTGFFKLLPYYFPIVYAGFLIFFFIKKTIPLDKFAFGFISLAGFFGTVYPASDLLHVYPFLGITIISAVIVFYKRKGYFFLLGLCGIFVILGVYLTFVMQSYRYEEYFLRASHPLNLPKTKGIMVDYTDQSKVHLQSLYTFVQRNTKESEYIFVYPFSPMLYTVLDRKNPSGIVQFVLLQAPDSAYTEDRVLADLKQKKVRYIIAVGPYVYDTQLSRFIRKQKKVYTVGPYIVFEIDRKILK